MSNNNNNRRQTLGGLSPAALNARQSLGPARIVKDVRGAVKGTGLTGRPSLAPGRGPAPSRLGGPAAIVPRRSSTYAKVGGPKNDPRPVSDKAYQANCIKTLIAYLSMHGYDQPLSPKMLSNPMGKDVMHILQFLMHQVDPYMKIVGKMEDEVPAFFKRMRYPFAISKSALFAVGSPHTWPGLLAALVWLTDLLCYSEKAERVREETFDEAAKQEADFFSYIATSYRHYLNGDDEECERVDAQQTHAFQDKADAAQAQVQKLDQEIQELQDAVAGMRAEPSPLEAARAELAACKGDRTKFLHLLEQLQGNREALQKKEVERQADLRAKQQELAIALQGNQEMRARIASQTISKEDVLRMNAERVKLEDRLATVTSAREAADSAAVARELDCERHLDHLDSALQAYNMQADALGLIPAGAKRAAGIQYEINLDRSGAIASELIDVDIKGTVKQGLQRQKDAYSGKWRDLEEKARGLDDALRSVRQAVAEREEQNAGLDAQVGQLEEEVAGAKRAMDADLREKAAEAERLKAAVEELRNATSHIVADSEAAILSLQAQQEELARSNTAEMDQLNGDLAEALQLLVEHKLGIQKALQDAHSHLQGVLQQVAAMPLCA